MEKSDVSEIMPLILNGGIVWVRFKMFKYWSCILVEAQAFASVAQPVERVLGKDEVASSNLAWGFNTHFLSPELLDLNSLSFFQKFFFIIPSEFPEGYHKKKEKLFVFFT